MMEDVLKEAGLQRPQKSLTSESGKFDLKEALDNSGLSLPEMFEQIASELDNTDNATLRQRIRETVLKMHGVLKDSQAPPPPSVTIVINDPGSNLSINPILIPRDQRG